MILAGAWRWAGVLMLALACGAGCGSALVPCAVSSAPGADSDGDGFPDQQEVNGLPGSDPCNPQDTPLAVIDTDGDGCSDFDEENFAGFCDQDPASFVDPAAPGAQALYELRVARHVNVRFSAAQVDARFADASRLLQEGDSACPDRATGVTFMREGEVEVFALGSGIVTSEAQLEALFDQPYDFKVVDMMIGVCGSSPDEAAVLIGCASGSVVITAAAASDVWAHEWGHVLGLGHRDDCPRNLMHATEVHTDAVNEFERNVFLGNARSKRLPALFAGDEADGGTPIAHSPVLRDFEEQIALRYRAGIPAETARVVAEDAPERLLAALGASRGPARCNVIRMLGFSPAGDAAGAAAVRGALQTAVLEPSGELAHDDVAVAAEALLALGRRCRQAADSEALEWLLSGSDPGRWSAPAERWTFGATTQAARQELLARLSILALGLSESPVALEHLREREELAAGGVAPWAGMTDQIRESIALLEGRPRHEWGGLRPIP